MKGYVTASAFVLDVELTGRARARARAAELWQPGAALRLLPGGGWLLELAAPVRVRWDRAPGLPLATAGTGLTAYGVDGPAPDREVVLAHGVRHRLDELVELHLDVDLGELPVSLLEPLDQPAPEPDPLPEPPRAVVELRRRAGLTEPPRWRFRVGAATAAVARLLPLALLGACVIVAAVAVVRLVLDLRSLSVPAASCAVAALAAMVLIARWADGVEAGGSGHGRSAGAGAGRGPTGGRERWWQRLTTRLAATAPLLRRRQLSYLEQVRRSFARRDWDRALRAAVPLGGVPGKASLGLPRPWQGALAPSRFGRSGGRGLGVSGVEDLFREVYRQAAVDLERAGELDKAAYVLADLLDAPAEAVQLLARHGRLHLAAALAESRGLEAAVVVRLWWRAGERRRAVDTALARGAFAQVLDRLGKDDSALARELRAAWAQARREAGDHLGAVTVAWPDPLLRPAAGPDIDAALARGGPDGSAALAYLLAGDGMAAETARTLIDDPARTADCAAFLDVFGTVPAADPSADRRIASAALRRLTVDPTLAVGHRVRDALAARADRLLVADLPAPLPPPTAPILRHRMPSGRAGELPVHDAVPVSPELILLAHGAHGVRLVRPDGRVAARWDLPAHRLIPADHGAHVLVASAAKGAVELHRLDLATRRTEGWATLRVRVLPTSYDGNVLVHADGDGIAFAATTGGRPRVTWRELDSRHGLALLARSADTMSALVALPDAPTGALQRWQWDLPGVVLRGRPEVYTHDVTHAVLLAAGDLILRTDDGQLRMLGGDSGWQVLRERTGDEAVLLSCGDVYAVADGGQVTVATAAGGVAELAGEAGQAGLRGMHAHRGSVALWDAQDRVLVLDTATRRPTASFPTRLG
ncbi:bpX6 domain-containing protein [Catellatospora vulcania]|uniref:bpX6 domain-containing protein n=1 Tax=Catellatospora vulcania TaxID=1460450 RepID=UPI0012D4695B|nr:bpX6 domain-containing protein [Catellatospora vulcania]